MCLFSSVTRRFIQLAAHVNQQTERLLSFLVALHVLNQQAAHLYFCKLQGILFLKSSSLLPRLYAYLSTDGWMDGWMKLDETDSDLQMVDSCFHDMEEALASCCAFIEMTWDSQVVQKPCARLADPRASLVRTQGTSGSRRDQQVDVGNVAHYRSLMRIMQF